MVKKLKEIADIQFGLYVKGQDKGNVKYLLSSHFNKSFQPEKFEESFIELNEKSERFLLKPNDIILAGKGHRIFAWAYDISFGTTIPSSIFYMIQTNPDEIIGDYLAYYLNSGNINQKLKLIGAGSQITSIPKKELEQLDIIIPPIEQQKKIVAMAKLLEKNIDLHKEIIEKKKSLKNGLISKMINNKLKPN
jgi:restriction endonuclease S subunit